MTLGYDVGSGATLEYGLFGLFLVVFGRTDCVLPSFGDTDFFLPSFGDTDARIPGFRRLDSNLPVRQTTDSNLPVRQTTDSNLPVGARPDAPLRGSRLHKTILSTSGDQRHTAEVCVHVTKLYTVADEFTQSEGQPSH